MNPNPRIGLSAIPLGVFFLVSRIGEPWQAILASFVASAVVFYYTRQDKLIGTLGVFGFVIVCITATIGIVTDSEKAYLYRDPITDAAFFCLHTGSMILRRPLIGALAHELFPGVATKIPINAPLFYLLGCAFASWDIGNGLLRIYLLETLSTGEYLVWSRVLGWPVTASLVGLSTFLVMREVKRRESLEASGAAPATAA
jgi:intracellular septation protein A